MLKRLYFFFFVLYSVFCKLMHSYPGQHICDRLETIKVLKKFLKEFFCEVINTQVLPLYKG